MPRLAKALATAAAIAAAGCSTTPSSGSGLAVTSPGASTTPLPAAASTAEPLTTAGAKAAADKYFELYSARRFAAVYPMLSPADRAKISEAVWVGVHQVCTANGDISSKVTKVTLAGDTAAVTVDIGSLVLVVEPQTFTYINGQWYYTVPNLSFYRPTTTETITALRSTGAC